MNDAHTAYLDKLLAPYGPTKPIPELVVEINRIFHVLSADGYDDIHPEIHDQLPGIWRDMLAVVHAKGKPPWKIIDFGAGTGFASGMALEHLPIKDISALTCFDLSEHMLAKAGERLKPLFPALQLTTTLPTARESVNLLLSNSVLHHLPDVEASIASLEPLLAPGAFWLAGHEPSSRFYANPECVRVLNAQEHSNRWTRFLRPSKYWGQIKKLFHGDLNIGAAKRCVEQGLFRAQPSADVIDRLVDFGVAHSVEEAQAGRGLDFRALEKRFAGRWTLRDVKTYSYMGNLYEGYLTSYWRGECAKLAHRFPDDGAMFTCLWQRNS